MNGGLAPSDERHIPSFHSGGLALAARGVRIEIKKLFCRNNTTGLHRIKNRALMVSWRNFRHHEGAEPTHDFSGVFHIPARLLRFLGPACVLKGRVGCSRKK